MRWFPGARSTIEATLALVSFHAWLATLDGLEPQLRTQGAVFACFLASVWLAWRTVGAHVGRRVVALLVLLVPSTALEMLLPGLEGRWLGCSVAGTASFLATSLALRACAAWSHIRARSLIWALTHAQLVVIATLLCAVIAALAVRQYDSSFVRTLVIGLPHDAELAVRLVAGVLPIVVVLASTAAIVLPMLLPPAFLISWLAARRMTQRVEQLVAIEAMACARRSLFARVSHELMNPLAALRAAVDGLRAREATSANAAGAPELDVLDAGVGRLTRLVSDLTDLARAEVGLLALRLEDVDVQRSVRSVANAERARAQAAHVALVLELDDRGPLTRRVDRVRFEQILTNLLHNALKHVEAGGIVRVRVFAQHARAVVVVEDTGSGIDATTLPRIFEPGFSRDGGLGLGLAVASELAQRMGGSLEVDAAAAIGARFVLRI